MENQSRSLRSTTDLSTTEWPPLTLNPRRRKHRNSGTRNVTFENMNINNSNNNPSGGEAPPADNALGAVDTAPGAAAAPEAADTAQEAAREVATAPAHAGRRAPTEALVPAGNTINSPSGRWCANPMTADFDPGTSQDQKILILRPEV